MSALADILIAVVQWLAVGALALMIGGTLTKAIRELRDPTPRRVHPRKRD